MDFVYFPTSCLVSLVTTLESGSSVEAATIGNDGFVGLSAFFGVTHADLTAVVQIEGEALRMKVGAFQECLLDARFRDRLGQYAALLVATISQSTACMAFHPVQERLARWLLLVRDGTERDEFPLTQDFLAVMRACTAQRSRSLYGCSNQPA